eukprot:142594-Prorocentrum_minimum.AAC.5
MFSNQADEDLKTVAGDSTVQTDLKERKARLHDQVVLGRINKRTNKRINMLSSGLTYLDELHPTMTELVRGAYLGRESKRTGFPRSSNAAEPTNIR